MRRFENLLKLPRNYNFQLIWLVCTAIALVSCGTELKSNSQEISTAPNENQVSLQEELIKVDVQTASLSNLSAQKQYSGTTQPEQQVAWRSQTEGTLLELSVKVGDRVNQGQLIGRLDDRLIATAVEGQKGELAALESELAQARIQVTNAQIKQQEAQIQLEQAKSDAIRYQNLAKTGVIPDQQAESFKTTAKVAQKTLLTAQEAIKLEEQAIAVIQGRIITQNSAIAESQQRQTYSQIMAPISGIVVAKANEPGSLVRAGEEVVKIGDFRQIKIVVPLSELDLGKVRVGQKVTVSLDAFGDRQFSGQVSRIAPTTNTSSRQIPVEVVVNNPENQIKGGLLARVNFLGIQKSSVVVPEMAVIQENGTNYIFTVGQKNNNQSNVTKRKIIVSDRNNGKVEILAGISPGEKYVVRSSQPLKDQDIVGLSIISN
jgi:HlyD family secretion protein